MDWAKTVRSIRQRLRLKQGAFAELVGLSQTSISRIESGLAVPAPDVGEAILKLRSNPKTRSVFDDFLASIEHSPYVCFLLQMDNETLSVEAASQKARNRYFPSLPASLDGSAFTALQRHSEELLEHGFAEGRIECAIGVWGDGREDPGYWRALYTPMRDGAETWYGYVTLIAIEGADFDAHVEEKGPYFLDIISYRLDQQ
ncbi:helix-turn-helix transcriptional regulator [Maricaulis sp.]|uniref:helix-turn-helix domain-containing protein n=1 Tax=Maricaulis sp. TaxID=1486257 RepID=UPI00262A5CC0|nr:helix-turn-helix transcriptional regulator [Maricaulis sp.]